jgi:hypothetical protein
MFMTQSACQVKRHLPLRKGAQDGRFQVRVHVPPQLVCHHGRLPAADAVPPLWNRQDRWSIAAKRLHVLACAHAVSRLSVSPRPWPYYREPTTAAVRRNQKNGFHNHWFFQGVNLPFFRLRRTRCRTMRHVGEEPGSAVVWSLS